MFEIQEFLQYLSAEKRYSPHTILSYKNDLNAFLTFLSEEYEKDTLLDVHHSLIRTWIVHLLQEGISPRSVNRKISTLKSFYNFQKKQGKQIKNPMIKIVSPKIAKRLPEFIPEKAMEDLDDMILVDQDFASIRNLLVVELLYQTGMRRAELIDLRCSDVDFQRKELRVTGKGNKQRIIPLSNEVLQLINTYSKLYAEKFTDALHDHLVVTDKGKKLYPKFVYNLVKRFLSLVSTSAKRSPHILRHSFATHLANRGAELNAIKELLGHANLAATQVYTHNTIDKLKKVYKKSHPKAR